MKKDEKKGRSSYKNNDNIYIDEKYTVTFKKKERCFHCDSAFFMPARGEFLPLLAGFFITKYKKKEGVAGWENLLQNSKDSAMSI